MEKEEAPDDEVLTVLGNWHLDRGNRFKAEEYYRKAMTIASGNVEASEGLRRIHLEDRPDVAFEFTSGSDSDNMEWSDISLVYEKMVNDLILSL